MSKKKDLLQFVQENEESFKNLGKLLQIEYIPKTERQNLNKNDEKIVKEALEKYFPTSLQYKSGGQHSLFQASVKQGFEESKLYGPRNNKDPNDKKHQQDWKLGFLFGQWAGGLKKDKDPNSNFSNEVLKSFISSIALCWTLVLPAEPSKTFKNLLLKRGSAKWNQSIANLINVLSNVSPTAVPKVVTFTEGCAVVLFQQWSGKELENNPPKVLEEMFDAFQKSKEDIDNFRELHKDNLRESLMQVGFQSLDKIKAHLAAHNAISSKKTLINQVKEVFKKQYPEHNLLNSSQWWSQIAIHKNVHYEFCVHDDLRVGCEIHDERSTKKDDEERKSFYNFFYEHIVPKITSTFPITEVTYQESHWPLKRPSANSVRYQILPHNASDISNSPTKLAVRMHKLISITQKAFKDFFENGPPSPNPRRPISEPCSSMLKQLSHFRNLVLEGVPGTGKTYHYNEIKTYWQSVTGREVGNPRHSDIDSAITFHPSTSYEDFVEGLRPLTETDADTSQNPKWFYEHPPSPKEGSHWGIQDGFFLKVCREAYNNHEKDFIILIDEINRANIPKVFGDLLTTIERSKRAEYVDGDWDREKCQTVTLPYSRRKLFVPNNVYIVATQNTTDRSVAPMDAALRRRFAFMRTNPNIDKDFSTELGTSIEAWTALNKILKEKIGPDAMLGHSYLYVLRDEIKNIDKKHELISMIWKQEIIPQLIDNLVSSNQIALCKEINLILENLWFSLESVGDGLHKMLEIIDTHPSYQYLHRIDDAQIQPTVKLVTHISKQHKCCIITDGKSNATTLRCNIEGQTRRLFNIEQNGDIRLLRTDSFTEETFLQTINKIFPSRYQTGKNEKFCVISFADWSQNQESIHTLLDDIINRSNESESQ